MADWILLTALLAIVALVVIFVLADLRREKSWDRHVAIVREATYQSLGEATVVVLDLTWFEEGQRRRRQVRTGPVYNAFAPGDRVLLLCDPRRPGRCRVKRGEPLTRTNIARTGVQKSCKI